MVLYLYHIASLIKFVLWVAILIIVYTSINVYEDPMIWIWLGFLGLFIACWGLSFYLFLWIQKLVRSIDIDRIRIIKDSYKLSLLFGIFIMINVLLLLLWYWNKILWVILLIWFVVLQIALFSEEKKNTIHNSELW